MGTQKRILPFFPLGVFLLPGEDIPLRIFEPRYLQLIDEAQLDGFTFAIPFMNEDIMMEYGCEVKLQQIIAESEQGKKVVTVESVSLIKINSYTSQINGKLYSGGSVEPLPLSRIVKSQGLINLVINYTEHYDKEFLIKFNGNDLSYFDIIKSLNLSSKDKYKFVEMHCDEHRDVFLMKQIEYLMMIRKQEQLLNDDFHLN